MIQRAQDAPRPRFEPPRDMGAGLALFGTAAALRAGVALLVPAGLPPLPPAADTLVAPLSPWLLSQALGATHAYPLTLPAVAVLAGALAAPAASALTAGLFGPTAGRAVGWSVALSPFLLAGALALDANVFAFAVLLALAAGAAWLRTPRRGRAFGAGLLCGIAAVASFAGVLLAPLILAWSWRPLGLTVPPRERLNQAGLVLLGLCVVVTPWTLRNSAVLRRWAQVTLTESRTRTVRESAATSLARLAEVWTLLPREDGPANEVTQTTTPAPVRVPVPVPAHASAPDGAVQPNPLLTLLAALEIAWLMLAGWGAVRTLSGPRRWYQSLPLVALLALMLAALTAAGASRARLGFEPLVALLAAIGALHARRAVYLWRRGLRLVRRGNTRPL